MVIRACLSSIPLYYISPCRTPVGVVDKIERIMRGFLWTGLIGKEGSPVNWICCSAKKEGGVSENLVSQNIPFSY